jgi:hypothetical protein
LNRTKLKKSQKRSSIYTYLNEDDKTEPKLIRLRESVRYQTDEEAQTNDQGKTVRLICVISINPSRWLLDRVIYYQVTVKFFSTSNNINNINVVFDLERLLD